MRAALYARVSTEEQIQNFSIQNQLEYMHKYCNQHDYIVFKEYVDPGWSGAIIERPALGMLLNDARSKLFDVVLVYKLDRLFRNNRHMYNTIAELEELGIAFASTTEPFDTTTTMGKAYLGLASTFAEWERNTFAERSRVGIRKCVELGLFSGGIVAYGYRLNPDTRKLEIEEQEAKIVKGMFHWLTDEGMTCYSIALKLNALGIPTRYTKDKRGIRGKATAGIWRPGRVYNMLKNPAYKGEWEYGRRSKTNQRTKGKCPAIVDEQAFNLAQARLRENNMWADRTHRRPYLLRGLIKCNICGHSYTGCYTRRANNKEDRYYRCNRNGNRGNLLSERCYAPQIIADVVEELVWQQICEFIQNPGVVSVALKDKFDACHQAEYVVELTQIRRRHDELKEAERRLLVKYADPANDFSEEALEGALAEIKASENIVQARLRELEEDIASDEEQRQRIIDVSNILSTLRERVKDATFETKRKVFELLLKEIRVGRAEDGAPMLNIVYFFSKDLIEAKADVQLHSSRMPLRLLRRPLQAVHLLPRSGQPLPEAHQRPLH
jgi:site-specific DNA recombinase